MQTSSEERKRSPSRQESPHERICAAAARVIGLRGVEGTRFVDVARAAGVSIGKVQHYFPVREELLLATFDAINDASIADWDAVAQAEPDARRRLSALLRMAAFGRPGWEEIGWTVWIEFWALSLRNPTFREQYKILYGKWRLTLVTALSDGVRDGDFQPRDSVKDTVDRLAGLIEGLAIRALLDPMEMPAERVFELLTRSVEIELDSAFPR